MMASLDDARAYADTYTEEDKEMFMEKRMSVYQKTGNDFTASSN